MAIFINHFPAIRYIHAEKAWDAAAVVAKENLY
jgi:hypothetical protein